MEHSQKKLKRVWLLSGIPGSGKSTWVKRQLNDHSVWCSRDAVRFSIVKENEEYFKREDEVFKTWIKNINEAIKNPNIEDIYVDATHLTDNSRKKTLNQLVGNFEVVHVLFKVPLETCLERNSSREGRERVPEHVIKNMYSSFGEPKIKGRIIYVDKDGLVFQQQKGE